MNQDQLSNSTRWPPHLGDDPILANPSEDDFASFLDLDSEFPDFEALDDNGPSGLDTPMGRLGFGQFGMATDNQMNVDMNNAQSVSVMNGQVTAYAPANASQQAHAQKNVQPQRYQVPLTPVSGDINGSAYLQHVDGNGYLVYDRNQSFTPLVSPAQTPMDAFRMPDYAQSTDFFSPLNSPAIETQHVLGSNIHAMSPAELWGENTSAKPVAQSVAPKRSQKKPAASTRTSSRSVKQSPAMKPQSRRRPPSVTSIPADLLESLAKEANAGRGLKAGSAQSQVVGSSDSSVSPEPLSEALMPPPAIPRSSGKSPQIDAESNEPATPATLMRMPNDKTGPRKIANPSKMKVIEDNLMEDISLPDSAIPPARPALDKIDTNTTETGDEQRTPTLSAKTAKLSASGTPRNSAATPQVLSPDDPNRLRRSESRAGVRSSKKRQGTGSATISPALRPKISPNITPLVPASGPGVPILSAETSALYLASKSNYQNILEGTHLPGVSYPEALAENLSSKRTSHKIAEQGRRNRINTALKEIEALLPASILSGNRKDRAGSNENEDGDKGSAGGQSASKASTVEMAITYIRVLQAEVKETKDKLEIAEKKLADGHSSSSQASE